jgi:hypothetical protein
LTWRESLRDIEACLNIQSSKLHLSPNCAQHNGECERRP